MTRALSSCAHRFDWRNDLATRPPAYPTTAARRRPFRGRVVLGPPDLIWASPKPGRTTPAASSAARCRRQACRCSMSRASATTCASGMRRARSEVTLVSAVPDSRPRRPEAIDEVRGRGVRLALVTNRWRRPTSRWSTAPIVAIGPTCCATASTFGRSAPRAPPRACASACSGRAPAACNPNWRCSTARRFSSAWMNLDPRSDAHNTEIGVFVDSRPLAAEVMRLIDTLKQQGTTSAGRRWPRHRVGRRQGRHAARADQRSGRRRLTRFGRPAVAADPRKPSLKTRVSAAARRSPRPGSAARPRPRKPDIQAPRNAEVLLPDLRSEAAAADLAVEHRGRGSS